MANKAISELPQALNVNNQDLFVIEQGGLAKKLPAETFITEQGIINALAEALDGHGGISSVTLSSVSGRVRTYRITFTDQSATTFQVYDGTSIDRISRTSSSGLDDVYTVFLSDGTTTFFTVHNGADGTVSEAMLNDALKNKAPVITETTESSAIANFTDGADDMPIQSLVADIEPVQDLNGYDAPWPAGSKNQLIFKTISGNIESNGKIVSTSDFHLLVAKVTAEQTYISSADGVATSSGALVLAFFSSEPEIGSVSYDGQRITTGQNPFVAPIDGYVAIRVASSSDVRRQIEAGSTATAYYPYSNICPISGHTEVNVTRTGINVWDEEVEKGYYWGQSGTKIAHSGRSCSKNFIPIKPNTNYYLKSFNSAPNVLLRYYTADKIQISATDWFVASSGREITTPNGCAYIVFTFSSNIDYSANLTINYPSSDHEYHAYQGSNTVTLSWQTEAGTVYGGTIDVATGLLTVDREMVDLGTLAWSYRTSGSALAPYFLTDVSDWGVKYEGAFQSVAYSLLCSMYKVVAGGNLADETICVDGTTGTSQVTQIQIKDPRYTDVATFKTAMSGVQLVYKLATPQTYQLSGQQIMTLLGTNNVWTDIANVSVKYPADTKMYIDNAIAALA